MDAEAIPTIVTSENKEASKLEEEDGEEENKENILSPQQNDKSIAANQFKSALQSNEKVRQHEAEKSVDVMKSLHNKSPIKKEASPQNKATKSVSCKKENTNQVAKKIVQNVAEPKISGFTNEYNCVEEIRLDDNSIKDKSTKTSHSGFSKGIETDEPVKGLIEIIAESITIDKRGDKTTKRAIDEGSSVDFEIASAIPDRVETSTNSRPGVDRVNTTVTTSAGAFEMNASPSRTVAHSVGPSSPPTTVANSVGPSSPSTTVANSVGPSRTVANEATKRLPTFANVSFPKSITPDDSSDSDGNRNPDDYIIVTSYHAQSGKLPDLIMEARSVSKKPLKKYRDVENDVENAREKFLEARGDKMEIKQEDGYVPSLEDELRRDDHSIIHAKPTFSDLAAPPLGAILRNPLKEGARIALPRRDKNLEKKFPYAIIGSPTGWSRHDRVEAAGSKEQLEGQALYLTSLQGEGSCGDSPYWVINIYTEHDKRIPCFTRPVNWIRVDVDIRFYSSRDEELNARLFTLLNYPLFLPQIRLQPLTANKPPKPQSAFNLAQRPSSAGIRLSCLLMRPIIGMTAAPTHRVAPKTVNTADLVPTKERYRRVWADMPDAYTIRSSEHSRERFTLILYILPDPAIASMQANPESNMPPALKGWRLTVMVVPPTKLGIQNVCHHEYFVAAPSSVQKIKRAHDDYLVNDSHGDQCFPFHILWEIKNRRKHFVSWSAVIEFSQSREELQQQNPASDIAANLLISSVPFHFGGADDGTGYKHLIGHAFLPKPNRCDKPEFHAKPRFTHLHSISLPRPAAYASRFCLPVSVHAFCLPEQTPDKERIINLTPYNEYCKQMISYARGLHPKRRQFLFDVHRQYSPQSDNQEGHQQHSQQHQQHSQQHQHRKKKKVPTATLR